MRQDGGLDLEGGSGGDEKSLDPVLTLTIMPSEFSDDLNGRVREK